MDAVDTAEWSHRPGRATAVASLCPERGKIVDARAAGIASHEAAHAVAAHLLGRRVVYVSRDGNLCGETYSALPDWRQQPENALMSTVVTLIAPVYVSPIELSWYDLGEVATFGDLVGADYVGEAHRQARELIGKPEFRNAHRTIEWALWSRPLISGEEVELLIALEQEIGAP